jgi:hypothetical protein
MDNKLSWNNRVIINHEVALSSDHQLILREVSHNLCRDDKEEEVEFCNTGSNLTCRSSPAPPTCKSDINNDVEMIIYGPYGHVPLSS